MIKLNADNQTDNIDDKDHNYSGVKALDLVTSITTIYPDKPVTKAEQSRDLELTSRLAQDKEEMEKAYTDLGHYHPIEQ